MRSEMRFDPQTGEPIVHKSLMKRAYELLMRFKANKILTAQLTIVIVAGMIAITLPNSPKSKVLMAFNKTFKEVISYETPMGEQLGTGELIKRMHSGDTQLSMNFKVDEMNDIFGDLTDLEVATKLLRSHSQNKALFTMGIDYRGSTLFDSMVYNDKDEFLFGFPEFSDENFYINHEEAKTKFKNSDLYELMEDSVGELEENPEDIDFSFLEHYFEDYWKENKELGKQFKEALQVKKISKKTFSFNNKQSNYAGYEVTLDKVFIKKFINSFGSYMQKDKNMKLLVSCMGMDYDDFSEEVEYMTETLEDSLVEDLVGKVYLNGRGRIIYMKFETLFEQEGVEIEMALQCDFTGGADIYDYTSIKYTAEDDFTDIEMNLSRKSKVDNKKYTTTIGFEALQEGDGIGVSCESTYNKETDAFEVEGKLYKQGHTAYKLNLEGDFEEISKGKNLKLAIDELKISGYTGYAEQGEIDLINVNGIYEMGRLTEKIVTPLGDKENLLKLDEEDIEELATRIGGKIEKKLYSKLYGWE